LSEEGLCYYEMKVQRGMKQVAVVAEKEKLDEGSTESKDERKTEY